MEDQGILLIDVTPLSLGVGIHGGLMSVVIPRGTTIPTKKTQVYTNAQDYQTSVRFPIYEGERPKIEDNHQLGAFQVDGIPPARKGQSKMSVTFEIDENSILTVTASDHATGKKESITITNEKDRLSKEDIEKMVRDSEKFAE
jgi:molecular chaperone DnaK (HSP70)